MAANLQVVVSAVDHASGVLNDIDQKTQGLGGRLKTGLQAGALAAAGGVVALGGALVAFTQDASAVQEAANKVDVVFGGAAQRVKDFADTSARSLGVARVDALGYSGTLGTILKGSGLTEDASADMSTQLVTLAADMASFNNIPIDQALEKIRAGLVGESEPLRTVGVLLSEAAVKQEAYATGIAAVGSDLTDQQKVQARYSLILKQTADTQGDFARTSDTLANQQRILGAEWKNLRATLGTILLPIITRVAQALTKFLTENQDDIKKFVDNLNAFVQSDALPFMERAFKQLQQLIQGVIDTGIVQWLIEHKEVLIGLAIALGILLIAFGGPIPIIVALIAAATLLLANWDAIRTKLTELWKDFNEKFPAIAVIVNTYIGLVRTYIETQINIIKAIVEIALGFIHGDFDRVWNGIKDLVNAILTGLKDSVWIILSGLGALALMALATLPGLLAGLFGQAKDAAIGELNKIPGLIDGLASTALTAALNLGAGIGKAIGDGIKSAWNNTIGGINLLPDNINFNLGTIRVGGPGPLGKDVDLGSINIPLPNISIPELVRGTSFIPRDMLALLHRGEAVIPANRTGGMGNTYVFNLEYHGEASMADAERFSKRVIAAVRRELRH